MSGIKNFAYTIPTIGRIAIGEKREHNGKTLPKKLNHFIITAQHQIDGRFAVHPAQQAVAVHTKQTADKIRSIPVKLLFNDPDLNVRERFEAYDTRGRMLCAGDGQCARRIEAGEVKTVDCPGADYCGYGQAARCGLMTRLNVQIDVPATEEFTPDPLSTFILRSGGFNTARTIRSKLTGLAAILNGRLTGVPLDMVLRQKSSAGSYQSVFFYVDLVPRVDLLTAAKLAKAHAEDMANAEMNQVAFEDAMRANLANGAFEDTSEDFLEAEEYLDFTGAGADEQGGSEQGESQPAIGDAGDAGDAGEIESPLAWMGAVRQQLGALEQMATH